MKLGLFGWHAYTGIGSQNFDLWRTKMFDTWLSPVYPNPKVPGYEPGGDFRRCRVERDRAMYRRFVREVDALVLVERPMLVDFDLVGEFKAAGKPVVLISNWEWFPPLSTKWVGGVSAIWCPNQRCYDHIAALVARSQKPAPFELVLGSWGALLSEWVYETRRTAGTFVFAAGNGGVEMRKGEDVIRRAAELTPEVQWLVKSQKPLAAPMPSNVSVSIANLHSRRELYRDGDVMVLPSRWEGCGLSFYEAQASGMPVFCPDAEPMRSAGVPVLFGTCGERYQDLTGVPWRYQEPDPESLAKLVRMCHKKPIALVSRAGRQWMETNGNLVTIAGKIRALAERLCRKS